MNPYTEELRHRVSEAECFSYTEVKAKNLAFQVKYPEVWSHEGYYGLGYVEESSSSPSYPSGVSSKSKVDLPFHRTADGIQLSGKMRRILGIKSKKNGGKELIRTPVSKAISEDKSDESDEDNLRWGKKRKRESTE